MKPDSLSENKLLLKPSTRWTVIATIVTALAFSTATAQYIFRFQRSTPASSNLASSPPKIRAVAALGHLKPEGEVIYLSAPTVLNGLGSSRVAQLLVKEGDNVKIGQEIAILDNHKNLEAALNLAREQVKVAQTNLAQVKAGAKAGEIEAQKATIARLEAELQGQLAAQDQTIARLKAEFNNGKVEYERYHNLFQNGAVTASQLDTKQLIMKTAQDYLNEANVNRNRIKATFQQQIKEAQATLNKIAEIRPTDVQAAQAEIERAIANVAKAQADLELAYVRAPINGQILKIYTRPGEAIGNKGILALGQTTQMNVVAEVYESDVSKLRVGHQATITSNAFSGKLYGTVEQIGLQVNTQDVLSTEPAANVDARVVEVKIRLNPTDSQRVAALTNLQVKVAINI
jgi:HlyD family secretion protein